MYIRSESSQKHIYEERGVAICDEHNSEGNLNASLYIDSYENYRILKYLKVIKSTLVSQRLRVILE